MSLFWIMSNVEFSTLIRLVNSFVVTDNYDMDSSQCHRCHQACCKKNKMQPILLPEELHLFHIFSEPVENTELSRIKLKANGDCLFLTADGRCAMFRIRPFICLYFPWIPVFGERTTWWRIFDGCPHNENFEPPDARLIPWQAPGWIADYQELISKIINHENSQGDGESGQPAG